jgi:uncharacterized protein YbaR (Trm112 family)/ubiquinone/menaquinone biosynthesis C-methylase UbiE
MIENLKNVKKKFDNGENIIEYLKKINTNQKIDNIVLISYDLQAGSYIKKAEKNPDYEEERAITYAKIINDLGNFHSIMEVGIGEATTFASLIPKIKNKNIISFGFDISYSRIQYAMQYLKRKKIENTILFTGNLFNCPIQSDSIDIVYSNHSLEPNGGKEREILIELFRVTRKYLVLLEPIYELSGAEGKSHMDKHGYIKNIYKIAIELGYKVVDYRILFESNTGSHNNTGVVLIEKDSDKLEKRSVKNPLACPITKLPLSLTKQHHYCKESMLLYPVINDIPCLLPENAIIATHFLD